LEHELPSREQLDVQGMHKHDSHLVHFGGVRKFVEYSSRLLSSDKVNAEVGALHDDEPGRENRIRRLADTVQSPVEFDLAPLSEISSRRSAEIADYSP
jgi:hypothetical protein